MRFRPPRPEPPHDGPDELIAVLQREFRRYRAMTIINGFLLAMGLGGDVGRLISKLWQ